MIRLQEYWERVLAARLKIEKASAAKKEREKGLNSAKTLFAAGEKEIKELKNSLKQDELSLADMSARKARLEERKKIIHTEKELLALEKEIDLLTLDIGGLEDATLGLIDRLDELLKKQEILGGAVKEKENLLHDEAQKLEAESLVHQKVISENEDAFNSHIETLGGLYKSKFLKMIKSKDGTGIARVEGEICGYCNFKIPSHLAIDAGNDEKVVVCTNCGKFIYR